MAKSIGNDGKPDDLSKGFAGNTEPPFFALGEPLRLVISLVKKKDECLAEIKCLDVPSRLVPLEEGYNPWMEPMSMAQVVDNPTNSLWQAAGKGGFLKDQPAVHTKSSVDAEQIARGLLGVITNELCDRYGNVLEPANQKLADAFRVSADPTALADMLTTLGREDHIQVGYVHGIYFYNYQSVNGLEFPVDGVLCEYSSQIPGGKPLGISDAQIKPLADTIREATTLDGDFTRLALAEIGIRPDLALLERAASMNAMLANTGNPKQLVELLNRQISQDERAVNRHGLNYVNEVRIRIDYPRMPRAVSDKADNLAPRLQVMDPGNTFLWTIDLSK